MSWSGRAETELGVPYATGGRLILPIRHSTAAIIGSLTFSPPTPPVVARTFTRLAIASRSHCRNRFGSRIRNKNFAFQNWIDKVRAFPILSHLNDRARSGFGEACNHSVPTTAYSWLLIFYVARGKKLLDALATRRGCCRPLGGGLWRSALATSAC